MWKSISIEKKILVGFALALLASLGVGVFLYQSTLRLLQTKRSVAHSREVMRDLAELANDLAEIESAQRGYVVTGDPSYAATVDAAAGRVFTGLRGLKPLLTANPDQVDRFTRLEAAAQTRISLAQAIISVRKDQGYDAARQMTVNAVSGKSIDDSRRLTREMWAEELKLLTALTSADTRSVRGTMIAEVVAFAVQLAILALLFWLIRLDINERRRTAEALARAGDELRVARDAALSANLLKSQFLANMSHEIRTPMNGVIGLTDILLTTPLNSKQRDFARSLQSSANSLQTIINDILDFSKIETGMLRLDGVLFKLRDTIESCVERFSQPARDKSLNLGLTLTSEVPKWATGDPHRLTQVLSSLLGNAIKFTVQGGVVVSCTAVSREKDLVLRVEVQDSGIGIAPEQQGQLFVPFTQADASSTRRFGGTGLGLTIAKQLVTGMGGEIGFQSEVRRGSTFWFTVQLGRGDEPHAVAELSAPAAKELSNVRVLIVDDDATNRKILHHQVTSLGMRDRLATSGQEALAILQIESGLDPFALAIVDVNMPGISGFALIDAIRAEPKLQRLKLIVLTSFDPADEPELSTRKIDACLQKPIRQHELFGVLRKVAEKLSDGMGLTAERDVWPITARRLRLLLAEDNEVNQQVALHQLTMMGHEVDIAGNGREALERIDRNAYDAILMDVQMPELDGYATTAQVRQREGKFRHTWIIALTAHSLPAEREKCLAAGMDDYLAKPISPSALAAALARSPKLPIARTGNAIDLTALLESGVEDILPQIIETFLATSAETLEKAKQALTAQNPRELFQCAHSLKGSSSNLGANRLVELCGQLEAFCRSEPAELSVHLLNPIEQELAQVCDDLLEYAAGR